MLGSDPMPWQLFLTLNWKKMIVVNILLAPIIFLQTAYLEEKNQQRKDNEINTKDL